MAVKKKPTVKQPTIKEKLDSSNEESKMILNGFGTEFRQELNRFGAHLTGMAKVVTDAIKLLNEQSKVAVSAMKNMNGNGHNVW